MATTQDIKDAVHDVLVDTLENQFGMERDEAYSHVRLSERTDRPELPGYTFEMFDTTIGRGIGDDTQVDRIKRDDQGLIESIVLRRDKDATIDVGAHADGDDDRTKNDLYHAAEREFTSLSDSLPFEGLHEDADNIEVEGQQDISHPEDGIRGDRLRISLEYETFFEFADIPTMERILADVGIEDSDGDRHTSHTFSVEGEDD